MSDLRDPAAQLRDIRAGLMLIELSESMAEVVNAVMATGKKGSVSLKLTINPASKGEAVVTVSDEIKTSLPQEKKSATLMFALPSGSLQRQDPRQPELDLQGIALATTQPLQVANSAPATLRAVAVN